MPSAARDRRQNKRPARARSRHGFGGGLRAAIYARVSTSDQQTIPEQVRQLERARREGKRIGRPRTAARHHGEVLALRAQALTHAAIASQLGIGETSVRRILAEQPQARSPVRRRV
jgi:DNA invertase Pin-like site-specific DNA recombinase